MNIQNIKKRAAAEKRFKFYGKLSIFTAITLLIVLFTSIISQGSSAFLETKILLQVHFDSNILDPKNTSNIEEIKKGNFNLAISKVYQKLSKVDTNWKLKKIKARFICALTIYGLKKNPIQSLGVINGRISKKKIGNKGFGYDPIFIPENKRLTFGQMSQKLKFKNDHRAKAFKKIKKFL